MFKSPTTQSHDIERIKIHLNKLKDIFNYIEAQEYYEVLKETGNHTFNERQWTKIERGALSASKIHNLLAKSSNKNTQLLKKATVTLEKIECAGREELIHVLKHKLEIPILELYNHAMKEMISDITIRKKPSEAEVRYYDKKLTIVKMQCKMFEYLKSHDKCTFPAEQIVKYFEQSQMSELYNDNIYALPPLSQYFRNVINVTHAKEILDVHTVKAYECTDTVSTCSDIHSIESDCTRDVASATISPTPMPRFSIDGSLHPTIDNALADSPEVLGTCQTF